MGGGTGRVLVKGGTLRDNGQGGRRARTGGRRPDTGARRKMNWHRLRRGDIAGILLMAVLLGVVVLILLVFTALGPSENFGFGPEWQCARMEKGDPICVRLVDKDAAK